MRALLIMPLPPPYAGPEVASKRLLGALPKSVRRRVIRTNYRKSNALKGRVDLWMALAYVRFVFRLWFELLWFPGVVYYTFTATHAGWVRDATLILLAKLFGRRLLLHFRGGHFRQFYEASALKGCIRRLLGLADVVAAQSPSLAAQFDGLAKRVVTLPNPVELSEERSALREPRVLFVGHLSYAKGFCHLLKALPGIVKAAPAVKFRFLGTPIRTERNVFFNGLTGEPLRFEDPDKLYRELVVERGLGGYVEAMGPVEPEKVALAMQSSSVFVLPSFSEGSSNALLEAMSCGMAIITTPVGAACDLLGESALYVQPGDVSGIEEAVARLLSDEPLRRRLGREAREKAEQYEVSAVAQRFAELLFDTA